MDEMDVDKPAATEPVTDGTETPTSRLNVNGNSLSTFRPSTGDSPSTDSPSHTPVYKPQFRQSTSALVLERHQIAQKAKYQPESSSLERVPLATLALPQQPHSPANLESLKASASLRLKRKRNAETAPFDITQTTVSLPTPSHPRMIDTFVPTAAPPPAVQAPPRDCTKCKSRSNTAAANILVACSKCPAYLHQHCSVPPIDDFRARDGSFVCRDCLLKGEGLEKSRRHLGFAQQQDLERMRRRRLDMLPPEVIPARPELVGFKSSDAPSSARLAYFANMGRTDLLNLLSFSDQLKPQLLADVLVSITKRHPDLPIFDSPDWFNHIPAALLSSSSSLSSHHRHRPGPKPSVNKYRHGGNVNTAAASTHTKDSNKAKHRLQKGQTKKVLKRTRIVEIPVETLLPEDDVNILPPTWRKAGEGLYASLPPETEDRRFLAETNDEEAFSHFFVDKNGRQIIEAV